MKEIIKWFKEWINKNKIRHEQITNKLTELNINQIEIKTRLTQGECRFSRIETQIDNINNKL